MNTDDIHTLDDLRRSVAEIMHYNPDVWPEHGNAALAIAAQVAFLRMQTKDQPVRWLPDGTPVGDVCDEMLHASLTEALQRIEARNGWDFSTDKGSSDKEFE